jgi:hypothetical protein
MSTNSERQKEMYQKSIAFIRDAITYSQSVLNDQYESLYFPVIEKTGKSSNVDQGYDAIIVEIGKRFTVILSQNKDEVERIDNFISAFKKQLARAYAKHCFNL